MPILQPELLAEAKKRGMIEGEKSGPDFVNCDDLVLVCDDNEEAEVGSLDSDDDEDDENPCSDSDPGFVSLQQGHDSMVMVSNLASHDSQCTQEVQDAIGTIMAYLQKRESTKKQTAIESFFPKL